MRRRCTVPGDRERVEQHSGKPGGRVQAGLRCASVTYCRQEWCLSGVAQSGNSEEGRGPLLRAMAGS